MVGVDEDEGWLECVGLMECWKKRTMTDGSSGDAHLSYVQIFNVNSTATQQGC